MNQPEDPPPVDPEVRERLDRHEDEIDAPDEEDAADRDEDDPMEGPAPTG
jgi:hypothetical protein